MSETITLENVKVVPQHIWRVTFELKKFGVWAVKAFRKSMLTMDNDILKSVDLDPIQRQLIDPEGNPTDASMQEVTLQNGKVLTMADILEAGAMFGTLWAGEDDQQGGQG